MHSVDSTYGQKAYLEWRRQCQNSKVRHSSEFSLEEFKSTPLEAERDLWQVETFVELLDCVAFLTAMNKRHTLYFRGQSDSTLPQPTLFRDRWRCFGSTDRMVIRDKRHEFFEELKSIAKRVAKICLSEPFKSPRWRDLQDVPEAAWAIVQHYELWPTPLIDITTSVNVAASFALGMPKGDEKKRNEGHLYVVALPYSSEGTTISVAERLMLSRLITTCPPLARRPHLQNGFLVGRYPIADSDVNEEGYRSLATLSRRLVAHFVLKNCDGRFWSETFPAMRVHAALPSADDDPLLDAFNRVFGRHGEYDVYARTVALGATIES